MAFLQLILLGIILVAGTGNGFTISQNRTDEKRKIEGGDFICIEEAPYQVYLMKDANGYLCGGALITPNIVLTAAHCFDYLNDGETMFVVAGTDSSDLTNLQAATGSVTIPAGECILHDQYVPRSEDDLKYDLAIVKLVEEFPVTKKISPIEISTVDVKEGDRLLLTGIGAVNDYFMDSSSCLKAYKPTVINCEEALSEENIPVDNFNEVICHKSFIGHRTRAGDSGGPMVNLQGKLVGIHSGTYEGSCQTGIKVLENLEWIREEVALATNGLL